MESKIFTNEFDDLSYWEFVNSSDAEDGFGSWASLSSSSDDDDDESEMKDRLIEIQQVVEVEAESPPPVMEDSEKAGNFMEVRVQEQYGEYEDEEREVDLDDEEHDDEVDLDDELVPWGLIDRLDRGRMRKLGKRSYAKMGKAKRVAFTFDRPGCVHGKHGLGLKHSF